MRNDEQNDEDEIVRDGEAIRVPMMMMDGRDPRPAAYEAHLRDMGSAWKNATPIAPVIDGRRPTTNRDAALAERDADLTQAWRRS